MATRQPVPASGEAARPAWVLRSFCGWDGDVLVLNVLGTPAAKCDAIGKVKGSQLKISVTAAPEDGKATDHMVRFLSREFGVSPRHIEVVFGRTNVNKQLRITSPVKLPPVIRRHLEAEGNPPMP